MGIFSTMGGWLKGKETGSTPPGAESWKAPKTETSTETPKKSKPEVKAEIKTGKEAKQARRDLKRDAEANFFAEGDEMNARGDREAQRAKEKEEERLKVDLNDDKAVFNKLMELRNDPEAQAIVNERYEQFQKEKPVPVESPAVAESVEPAIPETTTIKKSKAEIKAEIRAKQKAKIERRNAKREIKQSTALAEKTFMAEGDEMNNQAQEVAWFNQGTKMDAENIENADAGEDDLLQAQREGRAEIPSGPKVISEKRLKNKEIDPRRLITDAERAEAEITVQNEFGKEVSDVYKDAELNKILDTRKELQEKITKLQDKLDTLIDSGSKGTENLVNEIGRLEQKVEKINDDLREKGQLEVVGKTENRESAIEKADAFEKAANFCDTAEERIVLLNDIKSAKDFESRSNYYIKTVRKLEKGLEKDLAQLHGDFSSLVDITDDLEEKINKRTRAEAMLEKRGGKYDKAIGRNTSWNDESMQAMKENLGIFKKQLDLKAEELDLYLNNPEYSKIAGPIMDKIVKKYQQDSFMADIPNGASPDLTESSQEKVA